MTTLTKPQRHAIFRVWLRDNQSMTYREFRKTVLTGYDCLMVHWCGMWLGIELDGYTHS